MSLRLFVLLFLLVGHSATAEDYHVTTNGNDLADGLTPETAWRDNYQ